MERTIRIRSIHQIAVRMSGEIVIDELRPDGGFDTFILEFANERLHVQFIEDVTVALGQGMDSREANQLRLLPPGGAA